MLTYYWYVRNWVCKKTTFFMFVYIHKSTSTQSLVLQLIRQLSCLSAKRETKSMQFCATCEGLFRFTEHSRFYRLVYYHNTLPVHSTEQSQRGRMLWLACFSLWRLKEGMAIFTERTYPAPPFSPHGPTLQGWRLSFAARGCVLHQYVPSFSLPPYQHPPFFASPRRTWCTGTPAFSLKNQQPLMLDEGKRSWRRKKEGGVFPLIDS